MVSIPFSSLVAETVHHRWIPDDFIFVKELPKVQMIPMQLFADAVQTSVGKLDKKAMRVQYERHLMRAAL